MSARRGPAFIAWVTVTVLAASLLVGGGMWVASFFKDALAPRLSVGCHASVGEGSYRLSVDQTQNAALISAISLQRGMPARAASIALATALQESKLRNIDYGDMDSVGLFQQRPSQDWGSVEQIMDPVYSTNAFFNGLEKVPGYVDMPLNDAAQIVQRSAYPHAYAQHEATAKAFASALTGQSPAALKCTLPPATPVSTPAELESAAHTAFGLLPFTSTSANSSASVHVQVPEVKGWAVAQWAVANASAFGVTSVSYDSKTWERDANDAGTNRGWQDSPTAGQAGILTLAMATGG